MGTGERRLESVLKQRGSHALCLGQDEVCAAIDFSDLGGVQSSGQTLDLTGTIRTPEDLMHNGFRNMPECGVDILGELILADCPRLRQRSDGMPQLLWHGEHRL